MNKCCNIGNSAVVDSRPVARDKTRRRRMCNSCGYRWTTFEIDRILYLKYIKMVAGLYKTLKGLKDE